MLRRASVLITLLAGCLPPPPDVADPADTDVADTDPQADTDCEPATWFADADADGFGAGPEVQACEMPAGHADRAGDCDDDDASVFPGAPDAAGDLVDADCDGDFGCGDLDCDGYADIAVAAADEEGLAVPTAGIWVGDERGFSNDHHRPVPHAHLTSVAAGDLDGDGATDLVFTQLHDDWTAYEATTIALFGPQHDVEEISRIPTTGARGVDLADTDGDGFLEIVVAQATDGETTGVDSVVLGAAGDRYGWEIVDSVPTEGARAVLAEDFDADGFVDLAFANETDGVTYEIESSVYWGTAGGFSTSSRTGLATAGASGLAAADLDGDGDLDLVVANHADDDGYEVDSLIFWNDGGFSTASVTRLPTMAARDVAAADLDGDGAVDLVFANERNDDDYDIASYVYWNAAGVFSATDRTELDTHGANGVDLADADGDGHADVVFANAYGAADGAQVDSVVYWGAGGRSFDGRPPTRLDTNGAAAVLVCPGGERCR
jgi:hypothetical protein